jgi:hypothetical protein
VARNESQTRKCGRDSFNPRLISIFILLALPSLSGTQTLPKTPYSQFWHECWSFGQHWNPKITVYEVDSFAKSTWEGVKGDPVQAHLYLSVCCEESNMRLLDNAAGFGYSGATWPLIRRSLGWKGPGWWTYAEYHPYDVNKAVSAYFAHKKYDETTCWKWHNSADPKNNLEYALKVTWIKNFRR